MVRYITSSPTIREFRRARGFLASDVTRGRRVNLLFLLMSFGAWNSTMTSRPTPPFDLGSAHLRVARPTDRMEEVLTFYSKALGFKLFGRFKDHDGFDGIILSHEGAGYHLEFTRKHGHTAGSARPGIISWCSTFLALNSGGRLSLASSRLGFLLLCRGILTGPGTVELTRTQTDIASSFKTPGLPRFQLRTIAARNSPPNFVVLSFEYVIVNGH